MNGTERGDVPRSPAGHGPAEAEFDLASALGRPILAWTVTDGKMGDLAQCLGVAERLGLKPVRRTVAPRPPFVWLMPWGPVDPREGAPVAGSPIAPPFPDLAIASGRRAVPYLRAVRRLSGGRTFTVFLKDPRTGSGAADLVWVPAHDRLRGPNVLATATSPHRVSPAVLARLRDSPPPEIMALPSPRVAVLLGGPAGGARYGSNTLAAFAATLGRLAASGPAGFLVTASRRTPPALLAGVERAIEGRPAAIWRGDGENPYLIYLALADALVVTGDSANMVSEAAATGRPVHVFRPDGLPHKLCRFLDGLERDGVVHRFRGVLESTPPEPVDSTQLIAAEILKRMLARERA